MPGFLKMKIHKLSDLANYNRFFAFGCSFTNYMWPTWADAIAMEIDRSWNYGQSGTGNGFIFNRFIETNRRFNFGAGDLIIIQWTNIAREDRYVVDHWLGNGNIYSNCIYGESFLRDFACNRGYMIRDCAYIDSVAQILNNCGAEWIFISMVPFTQVDQYNDNTQGENISDVIDLYNGALQTLCSSFKETLYQDGWYNNIEYPPLKVQFPWHKSPWIDPHPTPMAHLKYLNKVLNVNLKDATVATIADIEKNLRSLDIITNETYTFSRKTPPSL